MKPIGRMSVALMALACALVSASTHAEDATVAPQTKPESTVPAPSDAASAAGIIKVTVHTDIGDILIGLDQQHAPITTNNFLRYVDQKRLDGCSFYRAVKLDDEGKYGLVQGGLRGNPKRVLKPIAHEAPSVTGLSHVDGAISMARRDPGTATADFFIVIGNLPDLDGQPSGDDPGYAVFGKVIDGMGVVGKILDQPRDPNAGEGVMKGQMLANPIKILTVRRTD